MCKGSYVAIKPHDRWVNPASKRVRYVISKNVAAVISFEGHEFYQQLDDKLDGELATARLATGNKRYSAEEEKPGWGFILVQESQQIHIARLEEPPNFFHVSVFPTRSLLINERVFLYLKTNV